MKTDAEIFCQRVRALRLEHHMSQRDFARVMGVSTATLRQLEQGRLPPRLSVESLLRLCDYFHLSPAEFLAP